MCCVVAVPFTATFVVVAAVVVLSGTVVVVEASDVFTTKGVVVFNAAAAVVSSFVVFVVVTSTVVVISGTSVVADTTVVVCKDIVGCPVTYFESVLLTSLFCRSVANHTQKMHLYNLAKRRKHSRNTEDNTYNNCTPHTYRDEF